MKSRLLVPWLILFACLSAAVTPALAREGADRAARDDVQQQVKESTARYRQAKAEFDRLAAEVTELEVRLADVDGRQAALRSLATRGAAALYMHDSTIEWVGGFGDGGEDTLDAARRARLVGNVSDLVGAAIRDLADSTQQTENDRRRLKDKRHEQEMALGQLDSERRAATGRFSAMVAAEKDEQRRQRRADAAERNTEAERRKADDAVRKRLQRASRSGSPSLEPTSTPLGFLCPLTGPFKWGDGWGAGRGHKGTDLLAPHGTENVAVVPGTFEARFWGGGGLTIFLIGDDGNTYVYMHLLRAVGDARHVEAGELIALTGASGNASAYHTHFEFHPGGGEAVDPYPLLVSHC
ncbi:MAG TPA: peptidoglycan DD-metalloendopeptidase family protein, partial [Actinomycetota bacterium]|nr:peptidoglycan DD-metalloendopeptidase family protein [Actinomycetota bacterium]